MLSKVEIEQLSQELAQLEEQKNAYLEVVKKLMENPLIQMTNQRIEDIKAKLHESNFKLDVKKVTKIISRYLNEMYVTPQGSRLIHQAKALIFTKYDETQSLKPVLEETIPKFINDLDGVSQQDLLNVCDVFQQILEEYGSEVKIEIPNSYETFVCPYVRQIEMIWDQFLIDIKKVNKPISPFVSNAKKYLINQVKTKATGGCDVTIVIDKAVREYMKKKDAETNERIDATIFLEAVNKVFNPNSRLVPYCISDSESDESSDEECNHDEFKTYTYKYSNPEKIRYLKLVECLRTPGIVHMLEKETNKVKCFKIDGLNKV